MVVYRYILKDKSLPPDRNTVYCLITEQKKDIVFEIDNFISTTEMLEHDKRNLGSKDRSRVQKRDCRCNKHSCND